MRKIAVGRPLVQVTGGGGISGRPGRISKSAHARWGGCEIPEPLLRDGSKKPRGWGVSPGPATMGAVGSPDA